MRIALVLLSLFASTAARAEGERTGAPYFYVENQSAADSLPLAETRAKVTIAGVIAHVRVTQVYQNTGFVPLEAVYVFPGSTRSAVFGMEMKVGDRTITAEIAKKEWARERYRRAKEEGKAASLLEQERPNVFQMKVANIMPADRIEISLDYSELLVPEKGVYEFVYPTVVGPRYVGERARDESWTANPHLRAGQPAPYRWGLSARIAAGMAIGAVQSSTHRISPRFDVQGATDVEVLDEDGGNRDFILRYRLDGDRIETGVLLYQGEKESFFTALVQPPKRVEPAMIPPREYLFIIDISGSMTGFPIATAKALMRELLGGMRSEDRFNVLTFAGGSNVMAEASVRATHANVARAVRSIDQMGGSGGTEILDAMKRALALPRSSEMSTTMVVITDGFVSVEEEVFTTIRAHLGEANLFAFGIGSSVNRHLIEGLAEHGMGRPFVVEREAVATEAAQRFREYVESPVLTNIEVSFDGFDAYDVEPAHLPDLFGERPLIIMGKYRGEAKGAIRIRGTNGQGPFEETLRLESYRPSDDLISLRYLWARDRIRRSNDQEEITRLGLEHHLMTEYTSFVAIDSLVRNTDGSGTTVRQPLPMPEGVDNVLGTLSGGLTGDAFGMGGLGTRGHGVGGGGYGRGAGKGERDIDIRSGSPIIMGSLDKSVIRRVIRSRVDRIRQCYEKRVAKDPSLAGKIVVRFTIGADGAVGVAEISSSTLADQLVKRCVLETVKRLRFPKPSGGGIVVVTYPFNFATR